jgi:hypothetical protein
MGEQNGAAGTWVLAHWHDGEPERVLYLHDDARQNEETPRGAVVYQPRRQLVRTVPFDILEAVPAPAVQPVAYMVEERHRKPFLVQEEEIRTIREVEECQPGTFRITPLYAAPQAGAAPRDDTVLNSLHEALRLARVGLKCIANGGEVALDVAQATIGAMLRVHDPCGWDCEDQHALGGCPICARNPAWSGAAPVDAREREEDAVRPFALDAVEELFASGWRGPNSEHGNDLSEGADVVVGAIVAALRGALPDTRGDLFKDAADAWERLCLPPFTVDGHLDGRYRTFTVPEVLRIAGERAAALSGTPGQPAPPDQSLRIRAMEAIIFSIMGTRARLATQKFPSLLRGEPGYEDSYRGWFSTMREAFAAVFPGEEPPARMHGGDQEDERARLGLMGFTEALSALGGTPEQPASDEGRTGGVYHARVIGEAAHVEVDFPWDDEDPAVTDSPAADSRPDGVALLPHAVRVRVTPHAHPPRCAGCGSDELMFADGAGGLRYPHCLTCGSRSLAPASPAAVADPAALEAPWCPARPECEHGLDPDACSFCHPYPAVEDDGADPMKEWLR